jgi:transposase
MRLAAKVPYRRWRTTTFLAAVRHDRIEAPWLLDGPIDGEGFRTYIEKVLVPTLKPGDIVILDNLGIRRGKAARQLIRTAGAKLFFLPKYSPDLNPIEQVFAKLKTPITKPCVRGSHLRSDRAAAPRLHPAGMRQLLPKRRICANLITSRSRLPARTMAGAQRGRSAPELLSPGSAIGSRSHLHEGLGNDPGRFQRAVI